MSATSRRRIRWDRVSIALVLLLICASYVGWKMLLTRSVTIRLEPAGYDLTYTMAWDTGMREKLALSKIGSLFSGTSSKWVELWKRPYNSGLSVYRTGDGSRYYLGTVYRLFIFETASGVLRSSCDPALYPSFTELGKQLDFYRSHDVKDALDPGGRTLFEYIEAKHQTGPVSDNPPPSRYYADLVYLGRFGLVRSDGRGNEIRFVPAGDGNEPRNSLVSQCG